MQTLKTSLSSVVECLNNKYKESQLRKEETHREREHSQHSSHFTDSCSDSDSSFNQVRGTRHEGGLILEWGCFLSLRLSSWSFPELHLHHAGGAPASSWKTWAQQAQRGTQPEAFTFTTMVVSHLFLPSLLLMYVLGVLSLSELKATQYRFWSGVCFFPQTNTPLLNCSYLNYFQWNPFSVLSFIDLQETIITSCINFQSSWQNIYQAMIILNMHMCCPAMVIKLFICT